MPHSDALAMPLSSILTCTTRTSPHMLQHATTNCPLAAIAPSVAASMSALTAIGVLSSAGGWADYRDLLFIPRHDNNAFREHLWLKLAQGPLPLPASMPAAQSPPTRRG